MKKLRNLRSIRDKRSYSLGELSEVLGVHIRTAQAWHKTGMKPIEGTVCPYLFMGREVKAFLIKQTKSKKTKLNRSQCFCVACRKAVDPIKTEIRPNNRTIGNGKESISLIGVCPLCARKVTRFDIREIPKTPNKKDVIRVDKSLQDLPLFNQFL